MADQTINEEFTSFFNDALKNAKEYKTELIKDEILDVVKNNRPIILVKIPFSKLVKYGIIYDKIFRSKDFYKMLLKCGGACSIYHQNYNQYFIIINQEAYKYLHEDTVKFIINHELGHIMHGDCEPNNRWKPDEKYADKYAVEQGCRIRNSALRLAIFESFSVIPFYVGSTMKNKIKLMFIRFEMIYSHFMFNISRFREVRTMIREFKVSSKLQTIIEEEKLNNQE